MTVKRWRDPTGNLWSALLTREKYGLHFSVKGNGRRPTDDEVDEAFLGYLAGAWVEEKLTEVTALQDELGFRADPHVRQFGPRWLVGTLTTLVMEKRGQEAST